MRRFGLLSGVFLLANVMVASVAGADAKTRGEIVGTVRSAENVSVFEAAVSLTGEGLIVREIQQVTGDDGRFNFRNLLPGMYTVTIKKPGFTTQKIEVKVSVGKTRSLPVILEMTEFTGEVAVVGQAPLIDQTSTSLATDFDVEELFLLPTTRNYLDVIDSAAGVHNRMAYGAGGNVEGYEAFGQGAATNNYQLNGVTTNNLRYGNTYVAPNYDLIQEIQVVGPGAGAEYTDYSGAVINMITKSGTNEFHGSASIYYTDHNFLTDNSGGILDLEKSKTKYQFEGSFTLGGPIVREKLTFFAGISTDRSENAPPETELYNRLQKEGYNLRLDWQASSSQTLTGMISSEPIVLDRLGLNENQGPEVGFYREQDANTAFLSWLAVWGNNTVTEVRFAGVDSNNGRIPNAPMDQIGVTDYRDGLQYNTSGILRIDNHARYQVLGTATTYVDDFLGGNHEFKGGIDYEEAWSEANQTTSGEALMVIIPLGADLNLVYAVVNYNSYTATKMERAGVFVQDKVNWGNATLTVGLRYDSPSTFDDKTGKRLLDFSQWSPRLGFAYDFSGEGRTVGRAAWGQYYDKVPTYGLGTYAGTNAAGTWLYYMAFGDGSLDPTDQEGLLEMTVKPENLVRVWDTQGIPVESGTRNPRTDIFNLGFDQQFGRNYVLSLSFVNRRGDDFIVLTQYANPHLYESFEYTSDVTGETFDLWSVTNREVQRQFALGNRDFNYQETNMFIAELRRRLTNRVEFSASVTFERSKGTRNNNECGILGLCSNGVDENPNYELNPFYTEGSLSQERRWSFKLRGSYLAPYGFTAGWDFRWYAGVPWGATQYCWTIDGCNDPYYNTVYLEGKDAQRTDDTLLMNLRLGKDFTFGGGAFTVGLLLDALNVTNAQADQNTSIHQGANDIYSRESARSGETVSAFGGPRSLTRGREFRLGVRFLF